MLARHLPQFQLEILLMPHIVRIQLRHHLVDLSIAFQVRLTPNAILAFGFAHPGGRFVITPPDLEVRFVLLLQRTQLGLVTLFGGRHSRAQLRFGLADSFVACQLQFGFESLKVERFGVRIVQQTFFLFRKFGQQARFLQFGALRFVGNLTFEAGGRRINVSQCIRGYS